MKTILSIFDKKRPSLIWWLSVFGVVIVGGLAVLAKQYVNLSPLFVLPVLLVSWYGSSKAGVGLAIFAAFSSLLASKWQVLSPSTGAVYDFLAALFAYLFLAILVTNFRKVHGVEVIAADTDALTGVSSPRYFYAGIANEILRSNRYGHIFSLIYIDIDDFKKVNDTFGHSMGDNLLRMVANCLKSAFRATDTVARIGGDEFVCLMPETEQDKAKVAILKAEKSLQKSMKLNNWEVTFSIGVVTFESLPDDIHEALKIADELMYSVKNGNKNDIAFKVWRRPA